MEGAAAKYSQKNKFEKSQTDTLTTWATWKLKGVKNISKQIQTLLRGNCFWIPSHKLVVCHTKIAIFKALFFKF